ncbi:MAG TPA: hypothetical protein VIL57_01455 [Bacteroidia bacterium]
MWKKLALFSLIVSPLMLFGQNDQDAIRYGIVKPHGTSRAQSLGGAINALGADLSNASGNVAGLGVFRKSQASFTFDVSISPTKSNFLGSINKDTKTTAGIGNGGFMYSIRHGDEKKTKGMLFSNIYVGYNKLNNFNKRVLSSGINSESSFLEPWLQNVNSGYGSNFYEGLAVNSELLFQPDPGSPFMAFDLPWPNFEKQQTKETLGKGSLGEVNFAYAGNVSNKLFFGASFNINTLNYKETSIYTESEVGNNDLVPEFNYFTFEEAFSTKGTGYNLKFGVIYRPVDLVRFGLSFHTPTWFTMTDKFKNKMLAYYDNGNKVEAESPDGFYRYRYVAPLKVNASVAFVIGRKASIGGEYEYSPTNMTKFKEYNGSIMPLTETLKSFLQTVHTVRLGGEYKVGLAGFRAGVFYGTSLTQKALNNPMSVLGISAGVGFKLPSGFYLDFAYQYMQSKYNFYLYRSDLVDATYNSQQWHTPSLTLGVAF